MPQPGGFLENGFAGLQHNFVTGKLEDLVGRVELDDDVVVPSGGQQG